MSSQYGELWPTKAEIDWWVWGTPENFNGFCVLASLLHQRHSTEVNQTLHDVWPSAELVRYIYIFGGSWPPMEFWQVQNSLHPSLAFCYIGSVTARHSSSVCQPNFAAFSRGRHLYLAGWPSRLASAHILVLFVLLTSSCLSKFSCKAEGAPLTSVLMLACYRQRAA